MISLLFNYYIQNISFSIIWNFQRKQHMVEWNSVLCETAVFMPKNVNSLPTSDFTLCMQYIPSYWCVSTMQYCQHGTLSWKGRALVTGWLQGLFSCQSRELGELIVTHLCNLQFSNVMVFNVYKVLGEIYSNIKVTVFIAVPLLGVNSDFHYMGMNFFMNYFRILRKL